MLYFIPSTVIITFLFALLWERTLLKYQECSKAPWPEQLIKITSLTVLFWTIIGAPLVIHAVYHRRPYNRDQYSEDVYESSHRDEPINTINLDYKDHDNKSNQDQKNLLED